ncbi:MAG: glycosyltransferase family 2 protein [Wenzhouxiangella sp.]
MNLDQLPIGGKAPAPLVALPEPELMCEWPKGSPPLVSVHCATYNHGQFIADALNGILAQETDFPFQVVVRDDASTDGTAQIVKSFAEAYPKVVTAILETENKWPQVRANSVFRKYSKGLYKASCEGDDYWIDPLKLQKQVEIIRRNPSVSLVASHAVHIENDLVIGHSQSGGTRTYLSKRIEDYPMHRAEYMFFGDTFRREALGALGELWTMPEVTAVWRKHPGGTWSSLVDSDPVLLEFRRSMTRFWMVEYFLKQGDQRRAQEQLALCMKNIQSAYPEVADNALKRLVLARVMPGRLDRQMSGLKRRFQKIFKFGRKQ